MAVFYTIHHRRGGQEETWTEEMGLPRECREASKFVKLRKDHSIRCSKSGWLGALYIYKTRDRDNIISEVHDKRILIAVQWYVSKGLYNLSLVLLFFKRLNVKLKMLWKMLYEAIRWKEMNDRYLVEQGLISFHDKYEVLRDLKKSITVILFCKIPYCVVNCDTKYS